MVKKFTAIISDEDDRRLLKLSAKLMRSKISLIREAIAEYLKKKGIK